VICLCELQEQLKQI